MLKSPLSTLQHMWTGWVGKKTNACPYTGYCMCIFIFHCKTTQLMLQKHKENGIITGMAILQMSHKVWACLHCKHCIVPQLGGRCLFLKIFSGKLLFCTNMRISQKKNKQNQWHIKKYLIKTYSSFHFCLTLLLRFSIHSNAFGLTTDWL